MKLTGVKKSIICAVMTVIFLVLLLPPYSHSADAATGKTVRIGYYPEAGMMNGAEEGAAKSGYVYEYIQELASVAGWKYEYVYGSFSELYQEFLAGTIDMLPYISLSEERTHQMLFPDKQMGSEQFYIASMTPGGLSSTLFELAGKKVGTTKDAFQNIPFNEMMKQKNISCELIEYPGPEEKWKALEAGEIDFCIETSTLYQGIDLHAVFEFGEQYPFYLVVAMGRGDLLSEMNRARRHLDEVNPGFLETLKQKYFKGTPLYKEIPDEGREWLNRHGVIRIGTFDRDEPYVIENADGSITGIAPGYFSIMLEALDIDIPVEWKFYDGKQSALEALRAGEIDLFNPYYRNYNDAEKDGVIISSEVYESSMSILYEDAYTDKTLSVIATPNTRLGAAYVRDNYPETEIIACSNGYDCIERFRAGDATCVILYTDALYEIANHYQEDYIIKSLNARCSVCFAALPENSALISVINKGAPFVSEVEMNEIQDRFSAENSGEITLGEYLRKHPEAIVGTVAVVLGVLLVIVLINRKKEKMIAQKEKENEFYRSVIERYMDDFEAVVHADLDTQRFEVVTGNGEMDSLFEGTDSLRELVKRFLEEKVYASDRDRVKSEAIAMEDIKTELPVGDSVHIEYRSTTRDGYSWCSATLSRISENEILIGYKECENEILLRVMNEKLMDEYDAIYFVDLFRNEILPAKPSKVSDIGRFNGKTEYTEVALKFSEAVAPEYRRDWEKFSDISYMKKYMAEDDHREYVFVLPGIEKSLRRLSVDIVERINGEAEIALFSFMGIDDVRAKALLLDRKMAQQKVLLDYFIGSFSSAYFVNLEEDTFEVLHMNQEISTQFGNEETEWSSMVRRMQIYVHPEDRTMLKSIVDKEVISEVLCEEESASFIFRERMDSVEKTVRGLIIRVMDEKHIAVGFMDITDDVHEEKEKELQLREALSMAQSANRAKTTFLNNMSHDMRTPMNAIIGFTGLAVSHLDDKEKVQDYLEKIGNSSEHLLSLINDVLDMSRIESGKMNIEEKEENLTDIIESLQGIVQADVDAKRHELTIDIDNLTDDEVFCDRLRLNQVLLNILSNSIKYTPDGGKIFLGVSESKGKATDSAVYEFCIRDNGMGMNGEFLKTIYDPFTREKSSTVSGIQGTGLGMAITKNIIDMMDGAIDIESEPGKGTCTTVSFEFRLQGAQNGQENSDIERKARIAARKDSIKNRMNSEIGRGSDGKVVSVSAVMEERKKKRLLLVEDNELNREIAMNILEEEGYLLDVAEDGDIAVEKLKKAKEGDFDLVFMDVQMPTMDGYEATRQIRALGTEISKIPIIAMTANAFEEDRQIAFEAGMDEHISKPIRIEKIREILNRFLNISNFS